MKMRRSGVELNGHVTISDLVVIISSISKIKPYIFGRMSVQGGCDMKDHIESAMCISLKLA
jgi:hypothetical protein